MTQYYTAENLDNALEILHRTAQVEVIAGGTDLVVSKRQGKRELPANLLGIDGISELKKIEDLGEGALRVGALVTHAMLMSDSRLRGPRCALADSAALIGSPSTRYLGTLGGNLANGSPAMDTGAPLVVLDALVTLRSLAKERVLPIEELFVGPGKTVIGADELLISVDLPKFPDRTGSAYVRLEYRQAMEIAIVGAATYIELDEHDRVKHSKIALTAVAPTVIRATKAEMELNGALTTVDTFSRVGEIARLAANPISDVRAPSQYREEVLAVIVARSIDAASRRARGESIPFPANRIGWHLPIGEDFICA